MASADYELPDPVGTVAPAKEKKGKYDLPPPIAALPPSGPDIGQGTAATRGLLQGMTLGLGDIPFAAAGAIEAGVPDVATNYAKLREAQQEARRAAAERIRVAREQYPKTTEGAEFAGAAIAPIPAPRGTGFLGRVGTQAGIGGATGFISSLGAEDPSLVRTALMTGVGTVVGAGMPFITTPLSMAAKLALDKLGISKLPWFRSVEGEAAQKVSRAHEEASMVEQQARARYVEEARQAAATGQPPPPPYQRQTLTPQELGPGQPGMVLDVTGAPGRALARTQADISPVAQATLENPLYQRRATQAERIEGVLPPTRYPTAGQQREALARPSPETNRLYNEAREIGDGRIEVGNTPLAQLAQTRTVQSAFRAVEAQLGDAHIMETMARQAQGLPPRQPAKP